jgi:hypothetical protein
MGLLAEWDSVKTILPKLAEMTNAEFEKLLMEELKDSKQCDALKKATELLILAMEFTGVKDVKGEGQTLVLWWPERGVSAPRGLHVKKSQYSGKNPWLPMIKDTRHCAVFGMATARCLQHDDIKTCRLLAPPLTWQSVEKVMFETKLMPADSERATLQYSHDACYLLYKGTDMLRVTRARPADAALNTHVVHMHFIPGQVPHIVGKYLRLRSRMENVREKQAYDDPGEDVLIL